MHSQTLRQAAVWLDQRKALVLVFTDNQLTTQTEICSTVDAHDGQTRQPTTSKAITARCWIISTKM